MIYLGCVLFRYVLIYNLEVSFNFHLTFEDISTIKCDENVHCAVKSVFYPTLSYFLRAPDNSNFFRFPLKVRVIRESTLYDKLSDSIDEL